MAERDYYDSPLHFHKVKSKTAYIDKYMGDVLIIYKDQEEMKDVSAYNDYVYVWHFDPSDLKYGDEPELKPRKMTDEGWLMVGFPDWDEEEIPFENAEKWIIMGLFGYRKESW
jgi:hypothetical protein